MMKSKTYISLSILRIIFILLIFLEHYPITPLRVGGEAVCFFFILSGFVLSYGYGNKLAIGVITYKEFLVRRLTKLYPLHWLLLPIGFWITRNVFNQTFYYIPANVLLLQSWIPNHYSYYSGNGLSWFLSTIAFLYMVFPYLWKCLSRLTIKWWIVIYVILIVLRSFLEFITPSEVKTAWLYISPFTRWMDFTVGIITFFIYRELQSKNNFNKILLRLFALFSIILTISTFCITYKVSYPLALFWISYSCLICGSILFESVYKDNFQYFPKLSRIINDLSNISFSFYLLHQIIILVLFNHRPFNMLNEELPRFIAILVICMIMAYLSFHYFEKPIAKRLQIIISGKNDKII